MKLELDRITEFLESKGLDLEEEKFISEDEMEENTKKN